MAGLDEVKCYSWYNVKFCSTTVQNSLKTMLQHGVTCWNSLKTMLQHDVTCWNSLKTMLQCDDNNSTGIL